MNPRDELIREAVRKRDAALHEAARWSSFIDMYQELAETSAALLTEQTVSGTRVEQSQGGRGSALADTERAAVAAIQNAGKALKTPELLAALQEAGIEVGGKDPLSTLSARLSRAESLENIRPHGWRLRRTNHSSPWGENAPLTGSSKEETPDVSSGVHQGVTASGGGVGAPPEVGGT